MNAQNKHQIGTGNSTTEPPTSLRNRARSTRRVAVCLLTLAGSLYLAQADTFVSGNISGTWTPAGNRYIVQGNCTVPPGQTLTIQPGVLVIIGQGLRIDVLGTISAVGTPALPITIRGANSTLYWDTIAVAYGINASKFANCIIRDATNALYLNLDGNAAGSGSMTTPILNCILTNCLGPCIYGRSHGVAGYVQGGPPYSYNPILSPTIQNCRFGTSSNGCVFVADGIRYNPGGGYPYTYGSGAVNPRIVNCDFVSMTGRAIYFSTNSYAATSYPNIQNNVFVQCVTAAQKDSLTLFNDTVAYNCFYNNQTNFVGYPAGVYGTICCQNARGSNCDLVNNIFENPLFAETVTYTLATNSPCIDAGNPDGAYLDSCFPPSQGTTVNDIGIYGGPNACGWITNELTSFSLTAQKYVGVTITPSAAGRYRLEYVDSLVSPPATNGPWTQATNLMLLSTPYTYIDFSSPTTGKRFYRGVLLP